MPASADDRLRGVERTTRLELATFCLEGRDSNQLSYVRVLREQRVHDATGPFRYRGRVDDPDTEKELLNLERSGWDSLCNSTGAQFYGDLMTDDGVMVLANGVVMDRDAVIDSLEHAKPWQSYDIDDHRVVGVGPDSAAIVYLGTGYRHGDQPAFVGLMSSVYVRQDGRWRLALFQQTSISS